MDARAQRPPAAWRTKPTDRFVLRWIKLHLCAPVTPLLARCRWLPPGAITLAAAALGVSAGAVYALGHAWQAGCIAAAAQVLDGVDGQLARFTGRESRAGAFWDSVLDRYADGALVIGLAVYLGRRGPSPPISPPIWALIVLGALALIGSNLVSYTSARAQTLELSLGAPTLASKGTRTAVTILCAWGSPLWRGLPLVGLIYLAAHTNLEVARRLRRVAAREDRRDVR